MRALGGVLLAIAAALGIVSGVVFGLDDKEIMVSPPDAVSEGFARQVAAKRYDRALPYLDDKLSRVVTPEALKAKGERTVHEKGEIGNVSSKVLWIQGNEAEATVTLQTDPKKGKDPQLPIRLTRSNGVWKISEIGWDKLNMGIPPDKPR